VSVAVEQGSALVGYSLSRWSARCFQKLQTGKRASASQRYQIDVIAIQDQPRHHLLTDDKCSQFRIVFLVVGFVYCLHISGIITKMMGV